MNKDQQIANQERRIYQLRAQNARKDKRIKQLEAAMKKQPKPKSSAEKLIEQVFGDKS